MKSRTKLAALNIILGALVILLTTACGKIPKGYQGEYTDAASGATLKLEASEGTLKTSDGRELKGKAEDADFDALLQGKQAIYLSELKNNNVDVFWLVPNMATRQESAGYVWFVSEVIYTQMNAKQEEKVGGINFFHCKDGHVMLNTATKEMNLGCPAGPAVFNMIRGGAAKAEATQSIERL
jgi:hypothetical protein